MPGLDEFDHSAAKLARSDQSAACVDLAGCLGRCHEEDALPGLVFLGIHGVPQ